MGDELTRYIMLGVFAGFMVVMFFFSKKKNKKQQDAYTDMINSLEPGDKVYLISRLIAYIVKVETSVTGEKIVTVETGIEGRKSTLTFDVQAIHTVLEKKNAPKVAVEEKKEEVKAVESAEEKAE